METQRVIEFPHNNMDRRPRKRPRLTWDMPPPLPPPKVKDKCSFLFFVLLYFRLNFQILLLRLGELLSR